MRGRLWQAVDCVGGRRGHLPLYGHSCADEFAARWCFCVARSQCSRLFRGVRVALFVLSGSTVVSGTVHIVSILHMGLL